VHSERIGIRGEQHPIILREKPTKKELRFFDLEIECFRGENQTRVRRETLDCPVTVINFRLRIMSPIS